jgi:hypothetical protein
MTVTPVYVTVRALFFLIVVIALIVIGTILDRDGNKR